MGKRILIISGAASSMSRFRSTFLTELVSQGHSVFLATPTDEVEWVERLRQTGAVILPMPLNRTGLNPFADFSVLLHLRRLVREVDPGLILAYAHKPVLYGLMVSGHRPFWGMLTGLGYVFTGGGLLRRLIRAAFRCVYPLLLRRAKGLLFLNPDDADTFRSCGLIPSSLPVKIIPGEGVDVERFSVSPVPAGPVKFLMLARLLRDKGLMEYAEAARRVKARYPDSEFHLAGASDSNPAAISPDVVNGWHAGGTLVYHGEVSDVRQLMQGCSVYVLPSYREGMPVSILEAMSTGRAVIATDVPGCRTAVRAGETGLIVPAQNAEELAEAMIHLIENPRLIKDMGAAGRARVVEKYSNQKVHSIMFEALGL